MSQPLFGFPALPQTGPGNMLIPWANCLLWCQDNLVPMIYTAWARLRPVPILRRETSGSASPFREAITDLLALAEASAVITSRSAFSLWDCYLGQVPSAWYPKKSDICGKGVMGGEEAEALEVEWAPGGALPRGIVVAVLDRVRHRVET